MSAIQRFLEYVYIYGLKGGNTWYIVVCRLYGRCLLFGVSAKRGFTVLLKCCPVYRAYC